MSYMEMETKIAISALVVIVLLIVAAFFGAYYINDYAVKTHLVKSKSNRLQVTRDASLGTFAFCYIIQDTKTNEKYLAIPNVGVTKLEESE